MAARKKKSRKNKRPVSTKKKPIPVSPVEEETVTAKKEKRQWLPYLLLLAVAFLLYGSSINFEYVLDDKIVLSENNFVKQGLDGISDIFTTESFTGYLGEQRDLVVGARYRPLSIAMFAVEYELFGLNPVVGHFINILLYGVTGMLILFILKTLWPYKKNRWWMAVPFVAALLFILHPIHTEVVANIKSRDEILSLLFGLLALYLSYRYVMNGKKYNLIICALIFLLALLAKENAITLVAVIPLTLFVFKNISAKKIFAVLTPLLLASLTFIWIRYQVVGYFLDSGKEITGLMNNPFLGLDTSEKYATVVYTLGYYLKLLFYPHPLTHDYYPYQIPIMSWGSWKVILSLLLYLAMIIYALLKLRKRSIAAWAIVTFLATLSIVSNLFFAIGTFLNERFLYMPSIAFAVLIAYLMIEKLPVYFKKPNLSKGLVYSLLTILIIGYSFKTIDRVPAWESPLSLNRAASTVSVNSARMNQFMAYSLYLEANKSNDRSEKLKMLEEATTFVDRALEIHPTYPDANNCKAGVAAGLYQLNGDLDLLLQHFYDIQMRHITPFVDTYMDYLDQRADRGKLNAFYRKLGTDLVLKGKRGKGEFYLRKLGE